MRILPHIFGLLVFFSLVAGCRGAPPAVTPTAIPPTGMPPPTPTAVVDGPLPAPTQPARTSIQVPPGEAPVIDGTFSPGEWDGALAAGLTYGGELLLMHSGGYLYLGIRSRAMGYGSICTSNKDVISILHSSAGLGTAVFEREGDEWRRTQQFAYCCWEAGQTVLDQFLQDEGWVASVGPRGVPDEMEYQIAMQDGSLNLAVVYVDDFTFETALYWPADLKDDCLGLTRTPEDPPEWLSFAPETWVTVEASTSPAASPSTASDPGGGVLAFTSARDGNMEIYVMDGDGSNPQRLTNQPGDDYWPTWSPDGAQIAFASERDGDFEIYVMNADGTDPRPLTQEPGNDLEPAWSPDGSRIAFMVYRDGKADIFLMNADGSNRRPLTDSVGDHYLPKWSPEGDRIVFVSERDGNPEIYVMNADGTEPQRLTDHPSDDLYPSWSPDISQIAFYSERDGRSELYLLAIESGELRPLTQDNASVWVSDWSSDGNRIALTSERDGNREIYSLDTATGHLTRLTDSPALDGIPAWQP